MGRRTRKGFDLSKPIPKKEVEVVVVASPAQSMAERLRLHTVRRLGHFAKRPVRLVPTMTPQEVARHAKKELEFIYTQALDPSPRMREARIDGNTPEHELHEVETAGGNRWWVLLSAIAGVVECQGLLAHRDVQGRLRILRFFGTVSAAHHYPVGLADRVLASVPGDSTHMRLGNFLLQHPNGASGMDRNPDEPEVVFFIAALGGLHCIGKWRMEEEVVNYFELPE